MTDDPLAQIDGLVLDVDGVLTDGRIVYTDDGRELKFFHVRDGSALKAWLRLGKRAGVISGRKSPAVDRRAAELGLSPVLQGAEDKMPALRRLLAEWGLPAERVAAIGDDLADLPVLLGCGVGVAVADACPEVRSAARFVTRSPGGHGAVREAIERILDAQGLWSKLVEGLRGQAPLAG